MLRRQYPFALPLMAQAAENATNSTILSFHDVLHSHPNLTILANIFSWPGFSDKLIESTITDDSLAITLFTPTDQALIALGNETLDEWLDPSSDSFSEFLGNHGVQGLYPFQDGEIVKSAMGDELTFHREGDILKVNDATIVQADMYVNLGIVHIVDKVLQKSQPLQGSHVPTNPPAAQESKATDAPTNNNEASMLDPSTTMPSPSSMSIEPEHDEENKFQTFGKLLGIVAFFITVCLIPIGGVGCSYLLRKRAKERRSHKISQNQSEDPPLHSSLNRSNVEEDVKATNGANAPSCSSLSLNAEMLRAKEHSDAGNRHLFTIREDILVDSESLEDSCSSFSDDEEVGLPDGSCHSISV